jgi:membrane-bound lytic murein transglycosylase
MPTNETLDNYYDKILSAMPTHLTDIERKYEISFAEARDYAYTSIKSLLIQELELKQQTISTE